ncbi:MAG: glycosyltransferase family 4 protein, partial [Marinicaulis sp.]|nr:glycosyltransferase family 4 protein [Marinicaulis sp.]
FECFPYAVTEALALGCPVVTTPTFGPAEILQNGVELVVCKSSDGAQLASELSRLIENPDKAASMGAAGRRQMIEKFSADEIATQTLTFYNEVIAAKNENGAGQ